MKELKCVRVRDNTTTHEAISVYQGKTPDGSIDYSATEPVLIPKIKYMEDVVTAGFDKKSAAGQVFINPMKSRSTAPFASPGSFVFQGKADGLGRRAQWSSSPVYFAPRINGSLEALPEAVRAQVDSLSGLAITSAAARVNSATAESLVTLAELQETLSFMASPVKSMVALTKRASSWMAYYDRTMDAHVRRVDRYKQLPDKIRARREPPRAPVIRPFKVGKFTATTIPSLWLAYRYGIMPLIYEFEAYSKFLADAGKPARETARAKAVDTFKFSTSDVTEEGDDSSTGRVRVTDDYQLEGDISVRAGFLYEVDWSLQKQLGLGFDRVPMALYERIPLSFVADWFWNGADVYNALTAVSVGLAETELEGWNEAELRHRKMNERGGVKIGKRRFSREEQGHLSEAR
jgi:hypothetical protein